MKTIIISRIIGGIGNQLFCYAAARRLAFINGVELALDDVSGFEFDYTYQRKFQLDHFNINCRKATPSERFVPFSRVRRYVSRSINQLRPYDSRIHIKQEGIDFDHRLLTFKPSKVLYLEGYWQSLLYFKDIEKIIRQDLLIIPPCDEVNLAFAAKIANCLAVAVHVRFFEAEEDIRENNTTKDYYKVALDAMEVLVPNAHYFVFSNNPEAAASKIGLPSFRMTIIDNNLDDDNAFADLWLMTKCRHFIIANSTFSWWGAWLSESSGKIVMAPTAERFFENSFWRAKGLIPKHWKTF